jgi:hypothetical protein
VHQHLQLADALAVTCMTAAAKPIAAKHVCYALALRDLW